MVEGSVGRKYVSGDFGEGGKKIMINVRNDGFEGGEVVRRVEKRGKGVGGEVVDERIVSEGVGRCIVEGINGERRRWGQELR